MRLPAANVDLAPISPLIIQQASLLQTQKSPICESVTVRLSDRPENAVLQSEDQPKSLNVLIVDDNPINLKVRGYAAQSLLYTCCCL